MIVPLTGYEEGLKDEGHPCPYRLQVYGSEESKPSDVLPEGTSAPTGGALNKLRTCIRTLCAARGFHRARPTRKQPQAMTPVDPTRPMLRVTASQFSVMKFIVFHPFVEEVETLPPSE
jgi:hypothetical protein